MEDVEKLKLLRAEKLSTSIIDEKEDRDRALYWTKFMTYSMLYPYSIIYIYEDLKIKHCKTLIGAVGIWMLL